MKAIQILKSALTILVVVGLLFGCSTTKQAAEDDKKVSESSMTSPQERGVEDHSGHQHSGMQHQAISGMERIHFDFDQFTLSSEARETLGQNAEYLKANNSTKVIIEGHCDDRGSDEYNLALGESRARAAKDYLVSLGIAAKRLSVISYGEEKALDRDNGEAAWAKNRRAEFKAVR
ncbi:MAG: peptidoglycan-associated lipoprotein Pal [Desulfuromonadales bacterium]|nr:peptidoglycan-associated lipoprotein Pal [Desulfuromonadales bacterium]